MATNVILPALGMAQETGKIVRWLKAEGEQVTKGEPLVEIETDKATVELEAPAAGILANVAAAGNDIPVGQVIANILAPDQAPQKSASPEQESTKEIPISPAQSEASQDEYVTPISEEGPGANGGESQGRQGTPAVPASPLASRIAAEHNLDLSAIKPSGRRIQKADVLTYLQDTEKASVTPSKSRLFPASPKARRLAAEQGKDLVLIKGSGPAGAVLTADVLAAPVLPSKYPSPESTVAAYSEPATTGTPAASIATSAEPKGLDVSNIWRIMAERTTQSWTGVPHFYLVREVNASRLIAWHERTSKKSWANARKSGVDAREEVGSSVKITYTDLLVKIVAAVLQEYPRLNAAWKKGRIILNDEINIGLAVATEEGLVVPVISHANELSLQKIAERRQELVKRATTGKLRPEDIAGGTFTISNLGMYGIDAFNAIINPPQVAILAIGRIAERVVPVEGQPAVQPMMVLTLSCDHRAVDGARGAQFLSTLTELIEEPLGLLD